MGSGRGVASVNSKVIEGEGSRGGVDGSLVTGNEFHLNCVI